MALSKTVLTDDTGRSGIAFGLIASLGAIVLLAPGIGLGLKVKGVLDGIVAALGLT